MCDQRNMIRNVLLWGDWSTACEYLEVLVKDFPLPGKHLRQHSLRTRVCTLASFLSLCKNCSPRRHGRDRSQSAVLLPVEWEEKRMRVWERRRVSQEVLITSKAKYQERSLPKISNLTFQNCNTVLPYKLCFGYINALTCTLFRKAIIYFLWYFSKIKK